MNNEKVSKEKPIPYSQWTPEMKEESNRELEEIARLATESMKESERTGIWPKSTMENR